MMALLEVCTEILVVVSLSTLSPLLNHHLLSSLPQLETLLLKVCSYFLDIFLIYICMFLLYIYLCAYFCEEMEFECSITVAIGLIIRFFQCLLYFQISQK